MEPVLEWTGHLAGALQRALRMSNEAFAEHLGVAARTVSTWHQKPDRVPNSEIQQALDTALERASETAQARFERLASSPNPSTEAASTPAVDRYVQPSAASWRR
jgi:hypothetical protein